MGGKCFGSSIHTHLTLTLPPSLSPSLLLSLPPSFLPYLGIIVWLAADYGAAALKEAPKPDAENPALKTHDGEGGRGREREGGREGGREGEREGLT